MRASMAVDGENLVITLQNDASESAQVDLRVHVNTPNVNSRHDAGIVTVPAGATVQEIVPAADIDGFDVAASAWLRAELHYDYVLDGGTKGTRVTAIAAERGLIVPHGEAVERGLAIADSALTGPAIAPLAGSFGTFVFCFNSNLTFNHDASFRMDTGIGYNLTPDNVQIPVQGQFYYAYYVNPNGTRTQITGDVVDSGGCTKPIPRQTAGAENWVIRPILYIFNSPWGIIGADTTGVVPGVDMPVAVPQSGSPARQNVTFPAGEPVVLQAATFLASNATLRAATIGVTPGANILTITTTSPTITSHYCSTNIETDCPAANTMRVARTNSAGRTDANDRFTVAHENGHWLHHMNIGIIPPHDYSYSNTDAAPLSPTEGASCSGARTSDGSHDFRSIEWQTSAHVEGLADFFAALTYNSTAQKDCSIFGFDCEAPGRTVAPCTEWSTSNFFKVGDELDWTKMYWDYVTDKGGNMSLYLTAENNVPDSAWPSDGKAAGVQANGAGDHVQLIWDQLFALDPDQRARLNESAGGNIFDGTPDFTCTGNNGVPNGTGSGSVCCLKSCGTCGGSGCSGRPGGTAGCCSGAIASSGRYCSPNVAPCVFR